LAVGVRSAVLVWRLRQCVVCWRTSRIGVTRCLRCMRSCCCSNLLDWIFGLGISRVPAGAFVRVNHVYW